MKKIYYLLFSLVVLSYACTDDTENSYKTTEIAVQLVYPASAGDAETENVEVSVSSSSGMRYNAMTDNSGKAVFTVPTGIYEVSATDKRKATGKTIVYTGVQSGVAVTEIASAPILLNLVESRISQIVIKEVYNGGCQKDDGSGTFSYDKYIVLYNNSDESAELKDLCIAMTLPYNSTITNSDIQNGSLFYEAEGWIPAGLGYFYFKNEKSLNPGEQVVIALNNANDNTHTYSNSVDLSNPEYCVTYEPEVYTNPTYHPAPSANIPTSNYLPGFKYGTGNAWAFSNTSPALFIFVPENSTPEAFAADASNVSLYNGSATQVRKKVPVSWILDGVEIFKQGATNNVKRFTSAVDAGSVQLTAGYGYTLYRNVDREATEAIAENAGKLVYNYALGTTAQNGTTDPSGMDAEASIRLGARIIYLDTNNSSGDFHQRARASLKD
ncbi:MAG: DUF4876 domain-containing protein [Bacteroidales bacterium]